MSHSDHATNVKPVERRKQWADRRRLPDRRNQERLKHMDGDCRGNIPRRESDIVGTELEGENWWSGDTRFS